MRSHATVAFLAGSLISASNNLFPASADEIADFYKRTRSRSWSDLESAAVMMSIRAR